MWTFYGKSRKRTDQNQRKEITCESDFAPSTKESQANPPMCRFSHPWVSVPSIQPPLRHPHSTFLYLYIAATLPKTAESEFMSSRKTLNWIPCATLPKRLISRSCWCGILQSCLFKIQRRQWYAVRESKYRQREFMAGASACANGTAIALGRFPGLYNDYHTSCSS